jgi:hypothetical protein
MNQVLRSRSVLLFVLAAGCGGGGAGSPMTNRPADAAGGDGGTTTDAPAIPSRSGGSGGATPSPDVGASASGGSVTPPADADNNPETSPPPAPDASVEVGTPGACKYLLCESFEDIADGAPPNPAIWTRTSNDIVVDSARAANGGKKALHIPPLLRGAKYIRENKTVAAMGKSFYGRLFFWIEKQPTEKPATLYHWTLLEADEADSISAGRVLRLGGHIEASGTNWLRFNFETHGNPGETGLSDQSAVLSPRQWYCAEFYYSLTDNEARFWLDGVEDPKLHWKGPMAGYTFPAAIAWMTFGWAEYQAALTPWELWIDEIALDTKKIGCQ